MPMAAFPGHGARLPAIGRLVKKGVGI
jgi:hypothetical protein